MAIEDAERVYQTIKEKGETAGEDEFVINNLFYYPYTITRDCMDLGDIETYKIICKLVIEIAGHPKNDRRRHWVTQAFYAVLNRDKWQFIYVLMSMPCVHESIQNVIDIDTQGWCNRYYLRGPHKEEYERELELIERLKLSPMVRSQVKGFLFPN